MDSAGVRHGVREGLDLVEASLRLRLEATIRLLNQGQVPRDFLNSAGTELELSAMLNFLITLGKTDRRVGRWFPDRRVYDFAYQVRQARNDVSHGGMLCIEDGELALRQMAALLRAIQDPEGARCLGAIERRLREDDSGDGNFRTEGELPQSAGMLGTGEERTEPRPAASVSAGSPIAVELVTEAASQLSATRVASTFVINWPTGVLKPWMLRIGRYVDEGGNPDQVPDSLARFEAYFGPSVVIHNDQVILTRIASGQHQGEVWLPTIRCELVLADVEHLVRLARLELLKRTGRRQEADEYLATWMTAPQRRSLFKKAVPARSESLQEEADGRIIRLAVNSQILDAGETLSRVGKMISQCSMPPDTYREYGRWIHHLRY